DRRVARPALRLDLWNLELRLGQLQPVARVCLAALDLLARELAGGDRVHALDPGCNVAVSDAFDLEQMHPAELGDLLEGKRRVLDEPHRGRFGHQGSAIAHTTSPPAPAPAREDLCTQ